MLKIERDEGSANFRISLLILVLINMAETRELSGSPLHGPSIGTLSGAPGPNPYNHDKGLRGKLLKR